MSVSFMAKAGLDLAWKSRLDKLLHLKLEKQCCFKIQPFIHLTQFIPGFLDMDLPCGVQKTYTSFEYMYLYVLLFLLLYHYIFILL